MIERGSSGGVPTEGQRDQFGTSESFETSKSGIFSGKKEGDQSRPSDKFHKTNVPKDSLNPLSGEIPGFSFKPPDLEALRDQEKKKALAKNEAQPSEQRKAVQQSKVHEVGTEGKEVVDLPKFPDGELDIWPFCESGLKRIDNLPDETYNKQLSILEKDGPSYIGKIAQAAAERGVSFDVTPPEDVNVRRKGGGEVANDIWGHSIEERFIQIPRYVLSERPEDDEAMHFRPEIPSAHIIVNMVHEFAHGERKDADPEGFYRVYEGKVPAGRREEVEFTKAIKDEELATDVHAYNFLKQENVPITPAVYVAQIPDNGAMPTFREELFAKLQEEDKDT